MVSYVEYKFYNLGARMHSEDSGLTGKMSIKIQAFADRYFHQVCPNCLIRGAFGKFLAWSIISVTDLQTLSCLVSF